MKFFNNFDLQKNQLLNIAVHTSATALVTPVIGQLYFDTALDRLQVRGSSAWGFTADNALSLNSQNAAFYLARVNHTGTQLSTTISDLATTVQSYRLDQFAIPTASLSLNSQRIINLADPVNPQDAATMGYVQAQVSNAAAGIDAKPSVRFATTVNDTLTGLAARDGVTPVAGDRVLAKVQTTAASNGVYIASAGAWVRAADADASNELTPGAFWFVEEGTVGAKTQWRIENTGTIVVGTTAITINQFGAGQVYTASLGVLLTGGDFRAQVVAAGGILAVAGGLQVDPVVVARKFPFTIGDGVATSIAVTHNLNTLDISVTSRLTSTNEMIQVDWVATSVNVVTLTFATAQAAGAIKGVVIG